MKNEATRFLWYVTTNFINVLRFSWFKSIVPNSNQNRKFSMLTTCQTESGWKTDSLLALQTTQTQYILKVWNKRMCSLQRAETYREAVFSVENLFNGQTRSKFYLVEKFFFGRTQSKWFFFLGRNASRSKKSWVELRRTWSECFSSVDFGQNIDNLVRDGGSVPFLVESVER